jgi:hypothetical protein
VGDALAGGDEAGAELHALCAECEDSPIAPGIGDAPGGQHRNVHGVHDLGNQHQRRRAAETNHTAGLRSFCHDRYGAGGSGPHRRPDGRSDAEEGDAQLLEQGKERFG